MWSGSYKEDYSNWYVWISGLWVFGDILEMSHRRQWESSEDLFTMTNPGQLTTSLENADFCNKVKVRIRMCHWHRCTCDSGCMHGTNFPQRLLEPMERSGSNQRFWKRSRCLDDGKGRPIFLLPNQGRLTCKLKDSTNFLIGDVLDAPLSDLTSSPIVSGPDVAASVVAASVVTSGWMESTRSNICCFSSATKSNSLPLFS